jgi:hypothetical protein
MGSYLLTKKELIYDALEVEEGMLAVDIYSDIQK